MNRNSEIEGVVFADEGETSGDIVLKTVAEGIVITENQMVIFQLIKKSEISYSKMVLD